MIWLLMLLAACGPGPSDQPSGQVARARFVWKTQDCFASGLCMDVYVDTWSGECWAQLQGPPFGPVPCAPQKVE